MVQGRALSTPMFHAGGLLADTLWTSLLLIGSFDEVNAKEIDQAMDEKHRKLHNLKDLFAALCHLWPSVRISEPPLSLRRDGMKRNIYEIDAQLFYGIQSGDQDLILE